MRFEKAVKLDSLKPFSGNPRIHEKAGVEAIQASIAKFGWTNPILAQSTSRRVIAGHGRLLAAQQAGLKTVPVVFLDLDDTAATAYTIADNQLPTLSDWDMTKLKELLGELESQDFDVSLLGFSDNELSRLLEDDADPRDDAVPDVPKHAKTKTGDVYVLGEHRLCCGSATQAKDVKQALGGGDRT